MYTVYFSPSDYRGQYVVRRWQVSASGAMPREVVAVSSTLEEAHRSIPKGLYRQPRYPKDDPVILETWF